ncbi:Magnesium-dependent phosphatase [Musa troglodytarum]|uniref:Magnesium-dependent phosphatase n=1 Tax=Musa troglodytarum TaxID=320322 RepID=A0A9E7FH28_9LILI|nr:Magnesium-dependent phosphatase [Musa troglodytarum]
MTGSYCSIGMWTIMEIFSSWTHETEHCRRIQRRTGIPFKSMLFFDDELRNIEAEIISNLTLLCCLSCEPLT